ncbi:MAG: hypothetical protein RMI93_01375 [Caldimicrobium sp.]|nr:hypothetical protein [Caldimicrobium sp.]MDW8182245.1 hypothetical protein [Caldimicrobium sp.]
MYKEINTQASIKSPKEYVIKTFEDLLNALRENPHWAEELRNLILSRRLLELPEKFDEFVEKRFTPLEKKVDKIEQDVGVLKQDVGVLKQDVEVLKQDVGVLKQDVGVLKQDVEVLKQDVEVLKQDVEVLKQDVEVLKQDVEVLKRDMGVLKIDVGNLKGDNLERKVREKAPAYFGKRFRKIKLIDSYRLAEALDEAEERGIITPEERAQALRVDVLLRGRWVEKDKDVMLVVEVSVVAEKRDAERAFSRAEVIAKVYGIEAIPVVVGTKISKKLESKYPHVLFIRIENE